jgi:hypothetical protein
MPHHFTQVPIEGDPLLSVERGRKRIEFPLPALFTYGLLATEFVRPLEDLGSTIGFEWLASVADRLRLEDGKRNPSRLTRWMNTRLELKVPGQPSPQGLFGETDYATHLPRRELDAFKREEGPRLETVRGWLNVEYIPHLRKTAARKGRLSISNLDHAERFLSVHEPRLSPTRFQMGAQAVRGLAYPDLLSRLAAELYELYLFEAPLRECRHCGRIFAPRKSEASCRSHQWLIPYRISGKPIHIAGCAPEPDARTARDREQNRLYMAANRAGPKSKASREYAEWMKHNALPVGRPQKPYRPDVLRRQ